MMVALLLNKQIEQQITCAFFPVIYDCALPAICEISLFKSETSISRTHWWLFGSTKVWRHQVFGSSPTRSQWKELALVSTADEDQAVVFCLLINRVHALTSSPEKNNSLFYNFHQY